MPIRIINIHEAKKRLSRFTEQAPKGEPFVIAKAARPVVNVAPVTGQVRRLGFMAGRITVPDDLDRIGSSEIERLFGGSA
jgi:antitoxin (DNA-binding transcriptional repressor) of toxin-antitoxin stability system